MDLILWRHAEAQDKPAETDDLQRALTPRGEKQAARVAAWLDRRLPEAARILCSPALRCEQTVLPLGRKYRIRKELAPGAAVSSILEASQWPSAKRPILVVGHQPALGEVIARLLQLRTSSCVVPKGSVWWLRARVRDGLEEAVVIAVQSPELV